MPIIYEIIPRQNLAWRYILIEKNENYVNNNLDGKAKLLMICMMFLCLILFLWIVYSFYGFYNTWQKPPQNIGTDSYIDKAGFDEVKLILESRK